MSMKNSNDTRWDRTSDLPICNKAPYPLCYRGPPLLRYSKLIFRKANHFIKKVLKIRRQFKTQLAWHTVYLIWATFNQELKFNTFLQPIQTEVNTITGNNLKGKATIISCTPLPVSQNHFGIDTDNVHFNSKSLNSLYRPFLNKCVSYYRQTNWNVILHTQTIARREGMDTQQP